ncbi:MAG: hypothetical protein R3F65_23590 [bacterium]
MYDTEMAAFLCTRCKASEAPRAPELRDIGDAFDSFAADHGGLCHPALRGTRRAPGDSRRRVQRAREDVPELRDLRWKRANSKRAVIVRCEDADRLAALMTAYVTGDHAMMAARWQRRQNTVHTRPDPAYDGIEVPPPIDRAQARADIDSHVDAMRVALASVADPILRVEAESIDDALAAVVAHRRSLKKT